jgi:co-chaperonin GroES (HSP10)
MKYANGYLIEKGVKNGDRITFQPDSEYEFTVDGEKLYRMFDHQITMIL